MCTDAYVDGCIQTTGNIYAAQEGKEEYRVTVQLNLNSPSFTGELSAFNKSIC